MKIKAENPLREYPLNNKFRTLLVLADGDWFKDFVALVPSIPEANYAYRTVSPEEVIRTYYRLKCSGIHFWLGYYNPLFNLDCSAHTIESFCDQYLENYKFNLWISEALKKYETKRRRY